MNDMIPPVLAAALEKTMQGLNEVVTAIPSSDSRGRVIAINLRQAATAWMRDLRYHFNHPPDVDDIPF